VVFGRSADKSAPASALILCSEFGNDVST
jgi:hypothetical protein